MATVALIDSIFPTAIFGIMDYFMLGDNLVKYMGFSYIGYVVQNFLLNRGNTKLLSGSLGLVSFEALQWYDHKTIIDSKGLIRGGEYIAADFINIPIKNILNKYIVKQDEQVKK